MHKELSVKSRVRGDFHARFCERVRVKLPRSTRPCSLKVLDVAKTITTIRVRLPENRTTFTKTLFLTEKHLAVKPLFDLSKSES